MDILWLKYSKIDLPIKWQLKIETSKYKLDKKNCYQSHNKHILSIKKKECLYGESDILYNSSKTIVSKYKQQWVFIPLK